MRKLIFSGLLAVAAMVAGAAQASPPHTLEVMAMEVMDLQAVDMIPAPPDIMIEVELNNAVPLTGEAHRQAHSDCTARACDRSRILTATLIDALRVGDGRPIAG